MTDAAVRNTEQQASAGLTGMVWVLLMLISLAGVLSKPFIEKGLTQDGTLRTILMLLAGCVCLSGWSIINRFSLRNPVVVAMSLLTILFGVGSTYRMLVLEQPITFRAQFVTCLGFWAIVALAGTGRRAFALGFLEKCLRYAGILLIPVILWFFMQGEERIHEMVYLFVPLGAVLALRGGLSQMLLGFGYLLIWILFGMKNTTVIIGGFCCLIAAYGIWRRSRMQQTSTTASGALSLFLGVVGIAAAAGAYLLLRSQLPVSTGNADFRVHLYEKVFNLFLESPIWGTGFTSSPVWEFTLYDMGNAGAATQVLPSHSDILDLLGHGGLIAFLPMVVIFTQLLSWIFRHLTQVVTAGRDPVVLFFPLIALSGIIQMSFNPVLIEIPNGLLLFTCLGLAYATRPVPVAIPVFHFPPATSRTRVPPKRYPIPANSGSAATTMKSGPL